MMRYLMAVAALALAGCGSPTDPGALRSELEIRSARGAVEPVVEASPGRLRVSYRVGTSTGCHDFVASARLAGSALEVSLHVSPQRGVCTMAVGSWEYTIDVTGIPAGRYGLVHSIQQPSRLPWPVISQIVEVP